MDSRNDSNRDYDQFASGVKASRMRPGRRVTSNPLSGREVQEDVPHVDAPIYASPIQGPAVESGMRVPGMAFARGRGRKGRSALTKFVILIAAVLFVALVGMYPVSYVVMKPGPTYDVLGSMYDTPVIEVEDGAAPQGASTSDDSAGQLRMVTVSNRGGPGSKVSLAEVLMAKFNKSEDAQPTSELFPENLTSKELEELSKAQMMSSQSTAVAAALEDLGYDVQAKMRIEGAVSDSHAVDKVQEGDILLSITTPDGKLYKVDKPSVPFALAKTLAPETPVTLEVERAGKVQQVEISTYLPREAGEDFEGSKFGIYLNADVKLPLDVKIHLEDVGGPSAGLMFTLGIIDRLTPGDMTGGHVVAGTGTIGYDGEVQPIGGVVQKLYGAKRDGAEWFLVPKQNCADITSKPEGLNLWPVSSLADAKDALLLISHGKADPAPHCAAE